MLLTFIFMCTTSCTENNYSENNKAPSGDSIAFFPVHEYLQNEIKNVNSSLPTIYSKIESNGKKDSGTLSIEEYNTIAHSFLEDNIRDETIKKYYTQNIFQDNTTASFTFSYSTRNNSLPLQSVDVLVDTATQNVKRVFMLRSMRKGDTTITEKMGWKTNSSFFINRIISLPGNKETIEQISVMWDHKK